MKKEEIHHPIWKAISNQLEINLDVIDTLMETCDAHRKENAELMLKIAQLENDLVRWKRKVKKWRERATK